MGARAVRTISAPGSSERLRRARASGSPFAGAGEPPGRKAPLLDRRGFTLLELLLVVTIVAVLVGMVVPSIGGSDARRLNDAARELVLLLNRARQEAALGMTTWRLVAEPGEGRYYFEKRQDDGFTRPKQSPFASVRQTRGLEWRTLGINGQRAVGPGEVYLYPTGEQDALRLTLRSGDRARTVEMAPIGRAGLAGEGEED